MVDVEWLDQAIEDLFIKVQTERVAEELRAVAEVAVGDHYPPDGGAHPPLYWRRGLTRETRHRIDTSSNGVGHDAVDQAWNYMLVYKGRGYLYPNSYLIIGILTMSEVSLAAIKSLMNR